MNGSLVFSLIDSAKNIADLGSGLQGSHWWPRVREESWIDAFDMLFDTKLTRNNVAFYKLDASQLHTRPEFEGKYDLIVADHIFEHVQDPEGLARSIRYAVRSGGYVHVGIPDATNFTDIFYRLVHVRSGGHLQKFSKQSMIDLMTSFGFTLESCEPWADDWKWLEHCFDLKYNQVENVSAEEITYLCDTFRKELTPAKGYVYGYEYVFKLNE